MLSSSPRTSPWIVTSTHQPEQIWPSPCNIQFSFILIFELSITFTSSALKCISLARLYYTYNQIDFLKISLSDPCGNQIENQIIIWTRTAVQTSSASHGERSLSCHHVDCIWDGSDCIQTARQAPRRTIFYTFSPSHVLFSVCLAPNRLPSVSWTIETIFVEASMSTGYRCCWFEAWPDVDESWHEWTNF